MAAWVMFQRTQACNSACEEFLFNIVLGAVYIFSFFNAKEEQTRFKYTLYYAFCFVENTILIVFWFLYANNGLLPGQTHWYWIPGIIGHYIMFFSGIICMVLYYACFHPTGVEIPKILKIRGRLFTRREPKTNCKNDRPTFLDLRELPVAAAATASHRDVGGGSSNLRPGSRTSQSTPTLDEIDSSHMKISSSGGTSCDGRHTTVRKTSSAPTGDLQQAINPMRSLKYMRNDRNKC